MLIEYVNACRGTEPTSSRLEGLRRWGRVGLTGGGGRRQASSEVGAMPGSQLELCSLCVSLGDCLKSRLLEKSHLWQHLSGRARPCLLPLEMLGEQVD